MKHIMFADSSLCPEKEKENEGIQTLPMLPLSRLARGYGGPLKTRFKIYCRRILYD